MLFDQGHDRFAELAYRALHRGQGSAEAFIVCIEVDDPGWNDMAKELMPSGHAIWQQMRDRGELPTVRGCVDRSVADYICSLVPSVREALSDPPPDGMYHVAVLGGSGASIYCVAPKPEPH